MADDVYVSHLTSTLGSVVEDLDAAALRGRLVSPATALRNAGFERHHVCAEGEDAYVLARRCFVDSGITARQVDCIVYANCIPQNANVAPPARYAASRDVKHLMDFPACRLQAEFGMDRAFVIGLVQQACTGMLGSVRIAHALLRAEPELNAILCLTSDCFPGGALYEQAYNLISDGAAACLVSRARGTFRYVAASHVTNGALVQASDDLTASSYFTNLHDIVHRTLARAGMSMRDVRWVTPQNTNRTAWEVLGRLLDVAPEQSFVGETSRHGHVIAADNIMNLAALAASGRLARGDRILTFSAGFGSHWQCLLLECIEAQPPQLRDARRSR